jgi:hypothetical protein
LWGTGLLSFRQGDLPRALPRLERAVRIYQDADLPLWFSLMAASLDAAYTLCGRIADAVPLLTQAMEQSITIDIIGFNQSSPSSVNRRQATGDDKRPGDGADRRQSP